MYKNRSVFCKVLIHWVGKWENVKLLEPRVISVVKLKLRNTWIWPFMRQTKKQHDKIIWNLWALANKVMTKGRKNSGYHKVRAADKKFLQVEWAKVEFFVTSIKIPSPYIIVPSISQWLETYLFHLYLKLLNQMQLETEEKKMELDFSKSIFYSKLHSIWRKLLQIYCVKTLHHSKAWKMSKFSILNNIWLKYC